MGIGEKGKKRHKTVELALRTSYGMEIITENVIMAVGIAEIIFMKDIQENTVLEALGSGTHRQKVRLSTVYFVQRTIRRTLLSINKHTKCRFN